MTTSYLRSVPTTFNLSLAAGLNIFQAAQFAQPGTRIAMIYIVLLDASVDMLMAYGASVTPKQIFQGQCFTFGGTDDCPGIMDQGLYFGCVASAGMTMQIEIAFAPNSGTVVAAA